MEPRVIPTLAR